MIKKAPPTNRQFGLLFSVIFALITAWMWWRQSTFLILAFSLFIAFVVSTIVWPQLLTPLNRAWMALAALLHRVVSPIILGVLFYLVFTPFAIGMRLVGRDALARRFDPSLDTYWIPREPPGPASTSMHDQF